MTHNPTAPTARTPLPRLLRNAGLVFLGGMFGVGMRVGLIPFNDTTWLSATLIMNAIGAFALGAVVAMALRNLIAPELRLLIGTGAIGGFTSYSALYADVWWRTQELPLTWLVIAIVSVATGPFFAYFGWRLGALDTGTTAAAADNPATGTTASATGTGTGSSTATGTTTEPQQ
ncbi:fluoride efflux transporter FluC [Gulosibacter bifidus]|uniref:Fluoride-specific ion channel n=1 Tax=Gulosibacter bifidus TaxID=272239 RepID=A0ABW5RJJ4_9MICO|nr:CrcB family protein [Gulosibacter bifidus]